MLTTYPPATLVAFTVAAVGAAAVLILHTYKYKVWGEPYMRAQFFCICNVFSAHVRFSLYVCHVLEEIVLQIIRTLQMSYIQK